MNEICVPLASLAMPDEKDQMNPPEPGDKIEANIEGTLSRTEGDLAYLTIDAVNGKTLDNPAPAPTDEQEENDLRGLMANAPDRY